MKNSEYSQFYENLQQELKFSTNNCKFESKNLQISNDIYSLYRTYEIHLKDKKMLSSPQKFIKQLFFLFKSYAYSDFNDIKNQNFISKEVSRFFNYHKLDIDKLEILLTEMQDCNIPDIEENDLLLIKVVISYFFFSNDFDIRGIDPNDAIASTELTYKLACIYNESNFNQTTAIELFEYLKASKYYKSYNYYGELLFTKYNEKEKALSLFKEGSTNKADKCYQNYYYASMYFLNFDDILDNGKKIEDKYNKLCSMIELLLNCYSVGNIENCLDIILFFKLGCKHWLIKDRLQRKYGNYLNEIYQFLFDFLEKDKMSSEIYSQTTYYTCKIALGLLYYYDFIQKIKVNIQKASNLLFEIYSKSGNIFYQMQVSSIIYKIPIELQRQNYFEENIFNFHLIYLSRTSIDKLDASFYYSLAKLFDKGIGTPRNKCKAYIFYRKASLYNSNELTTYFWNQYRKYKSKNKLKLREFQQIEAQLKSMSHKSLENIDIEIECTICLSKVKQIVIQPCLHQLCNECFNRIENSAKCPICRGNINSSLQIYKNKI